MKHINRLSLSVVLGMAAFAAVAASAHFVRGPDASLNNSNGVATVTWKEAGLGDTTTVDYLATASASARYQCVNRGGNCPAASNKEDVFSNVSAGGTFNSQKNGTITGSLPIEPPEGDMVCPGNQRKEMVSVAYSNIALEDVTNGVKAPADPTGFGMSRAECP